MANQDLSSLVLCKTNIGGFFFDAFLSVDYKQTLTIADHPVAEGADISDHAFMQGKTLIMEIGMSDAQTSFISGQFNDSWSRSSSAYKTLQKLQQDKTLLTILTRLQQYQNMIIEDISVHDDYTSLYSLKATVTFREIRIASIANVKVKNPAPSVGSANASTVATASKKGAVQPAQASIPPAKKESLLHTTFGKLL